jgi:hypothetical protein
MSLVVTKDGEELMVRTIVEMAQSVKLYRNDVKPEWVHTAADYEEVRGGGYIDLPLSPDEWKIETGFPTYAHGARKKWVFGSGIGDVYGYYVIHEGKVLWAERFTPGPFHVRNQGDQIIVIPRFSFMGQ